MKNLILLCCLCSMVLAITSCSNAPKADKAVVNEVAKTVEKAVSPKGEAKAVNVAESKINWTGSKPAGKHMGYISLKSGSIMIDNGDISGGSFVLDMNSITCTDLEGDSKAGLESHLKGLEADNKDDFFNVTAHPTASFDITKVAKLAGDAVATHLVYGNLTLKGETKEVGFKAKVENTDGKITVSTPDFSINRTDFGIKFMSKTFVEGLKDKFIDDEIVLSLNIVAG